MPETTSWNSLKNVVLAVAAVAGGLAGFAAKYAVESPRTAKWRLERYEASFDAAPVATEKPA